MNFIPEMSKESKHVPFYEEAKSVDGWRGQATDKTTRALQSEIIQAVGRLGGIVMGFQKGTFQTEIGERDGYRIHYVVEAQDGRQLPGRIDIAALPIDPNLGHRADKNKHRDASLKMALYMLRDALDGTWFLQQLAPGFSALVPFMIGPHNKTISELWAEGPMSNLLPPGETEDFIVDGEGREIK